MTPNWQCIIKPTEYGVEYNNYKRNKKEIKTLSKI